MAKEIPFIRLDDKIRPQIKTLELRKTIDEKRLFGFAKSATEFLPFQHGVTAITGFDEKQIKQGVRKLAQIL